ncbi:hypothetical protein F4808DRAFT_417265 [Astrocystis sublimbata]|nr:hypothetical protein F4808DRAFT_417265 [Astrocystis sublimbata]
MAFIRPYRETDFDACGHICIETVPPTLAASPAAAKLAPYIWTHPYTFVSPSTCHILDDGTGNAVGYCIGCPDVHAFAAAYPKYIASILSAAVPQPDFSTRAPWTTTITTTTNKEEANADSKPDGVEVEIEATNPLALAQNAYRPDWVLFEGQGKEALTARWRATMHIDLLPEWQGRGWGRQLIDRFVASVQSSGQDYGDGEHIGIAGENKKVVAFYERVGFRIIQGGEGEGDITMVRDIEV